MKTKYITLVCALAVAACSINSSRATDDAAAAAADALIVRPASLVATAIGGLIWVVALPFTAPGGHVHDSARVLVQKPADATFKRPLGDFSTLQN